MIFRNKEKFSLVKSEQFKQLQEAFPEIKEGKDVVLEILPSMRQTVETDKGSNEYMWPEKMSNMKFRTMENGEEVTYLYQLTDPEKKDNGTLVFKKQEQMVIHTTRNNPMRIFNTNIGDVRNDLDQLFLLYFYSPEILGGKNCKDSSKARWRFKNEEREAQELVNRETNISRAVTAIGGCDLDKLSALFEYTEGTALNKAQMNATALKAQFIQQAKNNAQKLDKIIAFFDGEKPTSDVSEIVLSAIEKGVLIQSENGEDIILCTKNSGEKELIKGVKISDVETISAFLAKNGNLKGQVVQQTKLK